MALPQPSQPARTLPGELALGLALVINSLGVVLMLRSGGGISAISSLPYALSLALPALFQGALVAGLMVLRRRFVPAYLFSFVVGFLFGKLLDLQAGWLSPLPEGLPWRVGYFLLSYLLICLGIALSNHCGLPIIPTDLFPREVAAITGLPYARVKIGFDASCLAGTVVLTLCCLGQVEGLGIGTVAAALTMGKVIGWMGQGVARHLRFRPRAVPHRRLRQA